MPLDSFCAMYLPLRTREKDGPWDTMCVEDHDGADYWQCELCVLFFKYNADPKSKCKTCYSGPDNLCPVDKRIWGWRERPHTLAFCGVCMIVPSVWRCRECKSDLYHRHRDNPVGPETFCRPCRAKKAQQVEPEPGQGILPCIEDVK